MIYDHTVLSVYGIVRAHYMNTSTILRTWLLKKRFDMKLNV